MSPHSTPQAGRACRLAGLLAVALYALPIAAANGAPLRAVLEEQRLAVYACDALVVAYRFATDQKYPYFHPVNGPRSGRSVTTESAQPYPHHRSLFFGCDRVNGGNYWQDGNARGQIVSEGPVIAVAEGPQVSFTDTCLWRQPGQPAVLRDHRHVAIRAPDADTRVIDFDITLEPLVEVRIGKTNHSLFSARMAPELSVQAGGTMINAEGLRGEKETFGKPSAWMDYHGARDGVVEGLAILQHPANRWHPAPWFTRDYGFFSPTPMYWIEGESLTLPPGEKVTLRYRVVLHAGDSESAGIAGHHADFVK
jgi:hypothetical protein